MVEQFPLLLAVVVLARHPAPLLPLLSRAAPRALGVRQVDRVALVAEYKLEPLHRRRGDCRSGQLAPLVSALAVSRLVLLARRAWLLLLDSRIDLVGIDALDAQYLVLGHVAGTAEAAAAVLREQTGAGLDDVIEDGRAFHAQGELETATGTLGGGWVATVLRCRCRCLGGDLMMGFRGLMPGGRGGWGNMVVLAAAAGVAAGAEIGQETGRLVWFTGGDC